MLMFLLRKFSSVFIRFRPFLSVFIRFRPFSSVFFRFFFVVFFVDGGSAGGKREFGGGWLPNRLRKFFRTLTVKNPPARARAKQNTSNKAGVFYAKLCIIHK